MKIAFVGKGGSGKSTLTSLFIRYLQQQSKKSVLAIDADLNMSLAGLLGVKVPEESLISRPEIADAIRNHLKGTNPRVQDINKFLPTTPPGKGSNLISSANDSALTPYAVRISNNPLVNLLTVGTYERDGIGQSCYHVNLFVAENILSHTKTDQDFHLVCDMVAGTDAFAYSLHLQFDAIFLIAEPTPESVDVCKLYFDLARESGVEGLVHLIANKVEDEDDVNFIREGTGQEPLVVVPLQPELKKARQRGQVVEENTLDTTLTNIMKLIESKALTPALSASERLAMLHSLHKKLNTKKWVQLGYGDVQEQLDPDFHMPEPVGVLA